MSTEKIYDGTDMALEEGFQSYPDRVLGIPDLPQYRNVAMPRWRGTHAPGPPVYGRVDFGLWVADCECGGCEAVSRTAPFFFCFSCGNQIAGGGSRPVIFPDNAGEIEQELLERQVIMLRGETPVARARLSKPVYPGLSRSWAVGESVEDLQEQRLYFEEACNGL